MSYNAYYAEVVAMTAFLVMGARLLRMSTQTRGQPERYLSVAFLLWALGYILWDVPYALTENEWILTRFSFGGRVSINLGTIALAMFIRSVFRPESRWALWFVVGIAVGLIAGVAGSGWMGDWLGERPFEYAWYWFELVANVAPSAWMAAEGMLSYQNAKRRLRLGLCDALSCNRFLLWGLAGAIWAALEIVSFAQEIEHSLTGSWSFASDFLMGACEFVPVVLIWFAFFPPAAYRNRIARPHRPT
ncbi:MAG TPA: hypothetical protein VGB31_05810 [Myxococcota bacterium]